MDARDLRESSLRESGGRMVVSGFGWLRDLPRRERDAWGLVAAVFVADVALTFAGLQLGLAEGNPLMAYAIGLGGIAALVLAKTMVLVVAGLVRHWRPEDGAAIAMGVAVPWLVAVLINAATIA